MNFQILEKYFSGTASGAERRQALEFFRKKDLDASSEEELRTWWDSFQPAGDFADQSLEILNQINHKIGAGDRSRQSHFPLWKAAAVILVIIAAGFIFYQNRLFKNDPVQTVEWATKQAPGGVKLQFELPDGSMVHLNSNSGLKYSKDFETRRVILQGEAYFDVAKAAGRPFTVECAGVSTTALGTSFNIFSHQEKVIVSLASGKVKVDLGMDAPPVFLTPGEQVSLDKVHQSAEVSHFDLYSTIAWKEGIILFDENNLPEVVSKLERWFGVEIELVGAQGIDHINWKYSGEFDNESLENVLDGIGYVKGFSYKISDRKAWLIFDE